MKRANLEHIIRAAADIVREDVVVIGSQAVLGQYPSAPRELLISADADIFPFDDPERSIEIDGAIGEGSIFQESFEYYAHGVGPETPIAPAGWRDRLVPICNENTRGATGWCMGIHDVVLSKCAAERQKDWDYARLAIANGLVDMACLRERLQSMPLADERKQSIGRRLESLAREAR